MGAAQMIVAGGGPAGLAAERAYCDAGGSGAVSLAFEEADLPSTRPLLTEGFLRGDLGREELILEPREWFAERSVEVPLGARVAATDAAGSEVRLAWLWDAGVTLVLEFEVQGIEVARRAATVEPNAELATQIEPDLEYGAIPADASMRSANSSLSAAGEVTLAQNRGAGTRLRVEHWGDAIAQGGAAGRTLSGETVEWDEVPSRARLLEHDDGAVSVYTRDGAVVGVLTHECDEDYERGRKLVARGHRA